jgi:hypothetical protein
MHNRTKYTDLSVLDRCTAQQGRHVLKINKSLGLLFLQYFILSIITCQIRGQEFLNIYDDIPILMESLYSRTSRLSIIRCRVLSEISICSMSSCMVMMILFPLLFSHIVNQTFKYQTTVTKRQSYGLIITYQIFYSPGICPFNGKIMGIFNSIKTIFRLSRKRCNVSIFLLKVKVKLL